MGARSLATALESLSRTTFSCQRQLDAGAWRRVFREFPMSNESRPGRGIFARLAVSGGRYWGLRSRELVRDVLDIGTTARRAARGADPRALPHSFAGAWGRQLLLGRPQDRLP